VVEDGGEVVMNFENYLGRLILVEKKNGKRFTSMLVDFDPIWLIFENKDGRRSSERIEDIAMIAEL
jgi:hypothetical protein